MDFFSLTNKPYINKYLHDEIIHQVLSRQINQNDSMQTMIFKDCHLLTNDGYRVIFDNKITNQILHLHIKNCGQFDDQTLEHLKNSFFVSNLLSITLSELVRLTSQGLNNFFKGMNLTKLTRINLKNCYCVDDDTISTITQSSSKITYLNLKNCKKITDNSINNIMNMINLKSLEYLNLMNCYKISGKAIVTLLSSPNATGIKKLILDGLENFDIESLTTIIDSGFARNLVKFKCFNCLCGDTKSSRYIINNLQNLPNLNQITLNLDIDSLEALCNSEYAKNINSLAIADDRANGEMHDYYTNNIDYLLTQTKNLINLNTLIIPNFIILSRFFKSKNCLKLSTFCFFERDKHIEKGAFKPSHRQTSGTQFNSQKFKKAYLAIGQEAEGYGEWFYRGGKPNIEELYLDDTYSYYNPYSHRYYAFHRATFQNLRKFKMITTTSRKDLFHALSIANLPLLEYISLDARDVEMEISQFYALISNGSLNNLKVLKLSKANIVGKEHFAHVDFSVWNKLQKLSFSCSDPYPMSFLNCFKNNMTHIKVLSLCEFKIQDESMYDDSSKVDEKPFIRFLRANNFNGLLKMSDTDTEVLGLDNPIENEKFEVILLKNNRGYNNIKTIVNPNKEYFNDPKSRLFMKLPKDLYSEFNKLNPEQVEKVDDIKFYAVNHLNICAYSKINDKFFEKIDMLSSLILKFSQLEWAIANPNYEKILLSNLEKIDIMGIDDDIIRLIETIKANITKFKNIKILNLSGLLTYSIKNEELIKKIQDFMNFLNENNINIRNLNVPATIKPKNASGDGLQFTINQMLDFITIIINNHKKNSCNNIEIFKSGDILKSKFTSIQEIATLYESILEIKNFSAYMYNDLMAIYMPQFQDYIIDSDFSFTENFNKKFWKLCWDYYISDISDRQRSKLLYNILRKIEFTTIEYNEKIMLQLITENPVNQPNQIKNPKFLNYLENLNPSDVFNKLTNDDSENFLIDLAYNFTFKQWNRYKEKFFNQIKSFAVLRERTLLSENVPLLSYPSLYAWYLLIQQNSKDDDMLPKNILEQNTFKINDYNELTLKMLNNSIHRDLKNEEILEIDMMPGLIQDYFNIGEFFPNVGKININNRNMESKLILDEYKIKEKIHTMMYKFVVSDQILRELHLITEMNDKYRLKSIGFFASGNGDFSDIDISFIDKLPDLRLDELKLDGYNFELVYKILRYKIKECKRFSISTAWNQLEEEEHQKNLQYIRTNFIKLLENFPDLIELDIDKDIILKTDKLVHLLQCDSLKKLRIFKIYINKLKAEHLELISKSKILSNLNELTILTDEKDKIANESSFNIEDAVMDLLSSENLKNMNWGHFFNANNYLFNDTTIDVAITKGFFKNIKCLEIMNHPNITDNSIIKIIDQADNVLFNTLFNINDFIIKHKGYKFMTLKIYYKCFEDKFIDRIYDIVFKDDNYTSHMELFNLIKHNKIAQDTIDHIFMKYKIDNNNDANDNNGNNIRVNKDIYLDDEFMETFCHFKTLITQNNILVPSLGRSNYSKITAKGINLLIETYPYPNYPSLYFWLLDGWLPLLNEFCLSKLIEGCFSYTWIIDLDLSGNQYLSGKYYHILAEKYEDSDIELQYNKEAIDEILLKLVNKCPNLRNLYLNDLDLDDIFCEKFTQFIYAKGNHHQIAYLSIRDNPKITYVGLKYLYTIAISDHSLKDINAYCKERLYLPSIVLLNNGFDAALKCKFQQYRNEYRRINGIKYYDHACLPLIFYSCICPLFAASQFFDPEIAKSRILRKIRGIFNTLVIKMRRMLGTGAKETRYVYFTLTNDHDTDSKRDYYLFDKALINLNKYLKQKTVFILFIINAILYYFISLFFPLYFVSPCGQSQNLIVYYAYGGYAGVSLILEAWIYRKMIKTIANDYVAMFSASSLVKFIVSQSTKLTLFTDMLYLTASLQCGNWVRSGLSIASLAAYLLFSITQIIMNIIGFLLMKVKDEHNTSYINIIGKFAYNLDLVSISRLLERFSTSCAIRSDRTFIPQIMLINVAKFVCQNLPHAIIQASSLAISVDQTQIILFLVTLILSLVNLSISFYTVLTIQPSICTEIMVNKLSYEKIDDILIIEEEAQTKDKQESLDHEKNMKKKPSQVNPHYDQVTLINNVCIDVNNNE